MKVFGISILSAMFLFACGSSKLDNASGVASVSTSKDIIKCSSAPTTQIGAQVFELTVDKNDPANKSSLIITTLEPNAGAPYPMPMKCEMLNKTNSPGHGRVNLYTCSKIGTPSIYGSTGATVYVEQGADDRLVTKADVHQTIMCTPPTITTLTCE